MTERLGSPAVPPENQLVGFPDYVSGKIKRTSTERWHIRKKTIEAHPRYLAKCAVKVLKPISHRCFHASNRRGGELQSVAPDHPLYAGSPHSAEAEAEDRCLSGSQPAQIKTSSNKLKIAQEVRKLCGATMCVTKGIFYLHFYVGFIALNPV